LRQSRCDGVGVFRDRMMRNVGDNDGGEHHDAARHIKGDAEIIGFHGLGLLSGSENMMRGEPLLTIGVAINVMIGEQLAQRTQGIGIDIGVWDECWNVRPCN